MLADKFMKTFLSIAMAVALLSPAAPAQKKPPTKKSTPASLYGQTAPTFMLPDLDGNKFYLTEQLGKVVILSFFTTYCKPCKKEMPELVKLATNYPKDSLLLVFVDTGEKPDTLTEFLKTSPISQTLLIDQFGHIADKYLAKNIPTTAVVDARGAVAAHVIGYTPKNILTIKRALERLLPRGRAPGK